MDVEEAKNRIKELRDQISNFEVKIKKLEKEHREINKKRDNYIDLINERNRDIKNLNRIVEAEHIFDSVVGLDGYNMLSTEELLAISNGMDRTDYTKHHSTIPRWIDLETLVKEVIEFKKQYEGFVLNKIVKSGQIDTLPPKNIYTFTYKTPYGHLMSYGGFNFN